MNALSTSKRALRRGCAFAVLAGFAAASQAQAPSRSVRGVPQPAAPAAMTPGVAGPATPIAPGLPSPLPSPAGLNSQFPAGLPSPTAPNLASPATPAGAPPNDPGTVAPTSVMGAGGYGGPPTVRSSPGVGGGAFTALQMAQSFLGADANRDGELTRAEAQRLTIVPYSFEEMDRNRDGILTRFEYEDAVR